MANKIRFRRGTKAVLPALAVGEPGFCTDTKELFVGAAGGNVQFPTMELFENKIKPIDITDVEYVTSAIDLATTKGVVFGNCPEIQSNVGYWTFLETIQYGENRKVQKAYGISSGVEKTIERRFTDGAWSAWESGLFATPPQELILLNGWKNYGGIFETLRVTKLGRIAFITGLLTEGTMTEGTTIAILPAKHRPTQMTVRYMDGLSGGKLRITLLTNGEIQISPASPAQTDINYAVDVSISL